MRGIAIAALCGACSTGIVPLEREPIVWHHTSYQHGHWDKAGVRLDGGWTCGERLRRALAGVDDAERQLRRCEIEAYVGWGLATAAVVAPASLVAVESEGVKVSRSASTGLVIGSVAALVVGTALAYIAHRNEDDAIQTYNRAVTAP